MSNLMPAGWTAHQAPDGRWYYAHAPSGVTQWHSPAPQPSASHLPPQGPAPPKPAPGTPSHSLHVRPTNPNHAHNISASAARFVYQTPVEFKIKEKAFSLSGDAFSIKRLDTGEAVFKVKGNALSFKDSKTLNDTSGQPIYKMSESIMSLRGRMQIQDCQTKQPVVTLRKKGFIPMLGTSTIQAWTGSTDEGDPTYEIKGDWFRKDFSIKEVATGQNVATVRRKSLGFSNIVLEKDSYVIRVEPGRDAALIVFFVIAVDEQYRDDGERRGYGSLF